MDRHTLKWVKRANMWCLTVWENTGTKIVQKQTWHPNKKHADDYLDELMHKDTQNESV